MMILLCAVFIYVSHRIDYGSLILSNGYKKNDKTIDKYFKETNMAKESVSLDFSLKNR